jgi:hypothetical protein
MAEDRRNRPEYPADRAASSARDGGRSKSSRDPANDPLAELARLIGQSDPFADFGKQNRSSETVRRADRPAPEWLDRSAPDHRASGYPQSGPAYGQPPAQGYAPNPGARPKPYSAPTYGEAADYRQQPASDYRAEQDRYAPDHAAYSEQDDRYYEDDRSADDRYRVAVPSGQYDADAYYAEDGHMPPQEESFISPRRRGGLWVTVAAVLGLAVIGTAGAFGYRAFTSGSHAPAVPPVIKADPTPAKTVPTPPPQANAEAPSKPFQDRVAAPTERIVPREEQPVSLPIAPAAPRVTAPQPSAQAVAPLVSPPAPTSVSEPKKVKTVTIRQEPIADTAPALDSSARAPAARQAPAANVPTPEPAPPRSRVASRTPASASGAYVVQVSAQRTEAEAQSSYEALQSKYPSVLGSRSANIRRVDLGDKGGVFYRAQVGTFTTSEQATAFCNSLKDVGGQCIVQKN